MGEAQSELFQADVIDVIFRICTVIARLDPSANSDGAANSCIRRLRAASTASKHEK